ncbi:GNAT family N-acetyltransferase [Butyrivibrio fibrisolvens]|uniref:GNAT family N-acetyltransferase n=1 Tax=Butyrivibrio fibrisolvens TaxID=831 RepID=UPI0003B45606|nr:GNAT family N-acetyltransferase [Butyrivibrio fibrisolvens]
MNISAFFNKDGTLGQGERTALKRIDDKYKQAYLEYRTHDWDILKKDIKIWEFIQDDLWSYVDVQDSNVLYLAIVDNKGSFIGYATIDHLDSDLPSIGLELKREYRRQGHGKETVDLLLEACSRVLNKDEVIVRINSDNNASLALFSQYDIKEIGREDSEYIQALDFLNKGKLESEKIAVPKEYSENGRYIKRFLLRA